MSGAEPPALLCLLTHPLKPIDLGPPVFHIEEKTMNRINHNTVEIFILNPVNLSQTINVQWILKGKTDREKIDKIRQKAAEIIATQVDGIMLLKSARMNFLDILLYNNNDKTEIYNMIHYMCLDLEKFINTNGYDLRIEGPKVTFKNISSDNEYVKSIIYEGVSTNPQIVTMAATIKTMKLTFYVLVITVVALLVNIFVPH